MYGFGLLISYVVYKMSNQPKGGMEFFKKFADKGGSLFGGMKIKGPKEIKNVAQTETNLAFTKQVQQETKAVSSTTRDDFNMKKNSRPVEQEVTTDQKSEDFKIRKQISSKSSENSKEGKSYDSEEQATKTQQQKDQQVVEEIRQAKIQVVQPKSPVNLPVRQTVEAKKKDQVLPEPQKQKKKVQKVVVKKQQPEKVVKKSSISVKQQKKKVEEQKPKKSERDQVLDELNEYNIKLAQIIINQKNTQSQIGEIKTEISKLREHITHWSSQQSYYAEREEYEEADKLQTKIEQTQNKIDVLILELNLGEEQLAKQELEEMNTLKNQNSNMKKMGRKLKLIELALQDDAAVIKREELEKIETLKTKQEAEKKKISRLEKDITYQNEQIGEFEKAIKQEQEVKLNPLIKQKSKLETSKASLEAEIKELERKLKQKKSQLSQTLKNLSTIDSSISEINQSFREQNSSLQERKGKLSNLEKEYSQMKIECTKIEQAISKQAVAMEEKVNKKLSEANDMAELSKSMQIKHASFDDEVEEWRALYDSFIQNGKILKQYQEKHQQDKQKFKALQLKQSGIESQIEKLQQRRDALKQKIPIIEVQQKRFADLKNYKAAGIKKNEIKELTEELAKVKQQIEAYVIQEHALGMQLSDLSQSQSSINEQQQELKKNLAISKHRYLKVKISKIGEYKQAILKNGSSSNREKEKVIKQLSQIEYRMTEQTIQIEKQYKLADKSPKKQPVQQEQDNQEAELVEEKPPSQQENIVQEEDQENGEQTHAQIEDEHKQETEQETHYYAPPLVEQTQQIEQDDSGYVPLSLD